MNQVVGRRVSDLLPVALSFEGETITGVSVLPEDDPRARKPIPYLAPGFIDIQVNGYLRHDYCGRGLSGESVREMVRLLARAGVTRHVPTIVTGPEEVICANLRTIAATIRADRRLETVLPGIHVEGPFISAEDGPRGAHDRRQVRAPDLDEYSRWQEAADGRVRMVTVAPETPGAIAFIESIRKDGVIPAIGHTGASPQQIRDAVTAGAMISTHLGNGSHSTLPRLDNYLWEQLASDELVASLVADGFHLPRAAMKSIIRGKTLNRVILVSDVTALGGVEPGVYDWGGVRVRVGEDGRLGVEGTVYLAGAGHLLDRDIANVANVTGEPLGRIVETCTTNPAALFDVPEPRLEEGHRADLVLFEFEPGEEEIRIRETIAGGTRLFDWRKTTAGNRDD